MSYSFTRNWSHVRKVIIPLFKRGNRKDLAWKKKMHSHTPSEEIQKHPLNVITRNENKVELTHLS
jgi:hypothetical protein